MLLRVHVNAEAYGTQLAVLQTESESWAHRFASQGRTDPGSVRRWHNLNLDERDIWSKEGLRLRLQSSWSSKYVPYAPHMAGVARELGRADPDAGRVLGLVYPSQMGVY